MSATSTRRSISNRVQNVVAAGFAHLSLLTRIVGMLFDLLARLPQDLSRAARLDEDDQRRLGVAPRDVGEQLVNGLSKLCRAVPYFAFTDEGSPAVTPICSPILAVWAARCRENCAGADATSAEGSAPVARHTASRVGRNT